MTLRIVLIALSMLAALALVSMAFVLSHNSACRAPDPLPSAAQRMKAIVYRCYGSPDVLKLEEIAKPVVGDDEALIRIRAAAVNPLDWHYMRGTPYIMRMSSGVGTPKDARIGIDYAGTVEAVGANVKRLAPGDAIFGGKNGALAEYITVHEDDAWAFKPANLTFEQAAAVPVAALAALQGLRDKGHIQAGQQVLINGASGGVGTFAVQIAKAFGAEVTGVCSTRNMDLVRSLGADHVIDYTREDFTQSARRYDLILDNVGNHSLLHYRRALKPGGTLVFVGGPSDNPWLGPLAAPMKASLLAPFVDEKFLLFFTDLNQRDLAVLVDLMSAGKVTPVIDRHYTLSEAPAAMRYLEEGRARGKVIVSLE